ncbi:MAG: ABC transporter ATP-binding protein [Gemmataceae bacterium]|nr:ABC transporter ATP-binding protein [Gemmataceae bacterium]MCI0741211.1 ABC transporter ATP-binding protein [Gemmataceae bacterium]
MIHVLNLTKYYGDYPAIQFVSFDVPAGQIVGFLGPNGAGKSTTMRILTGYLTATSGKATIAGLDVFWDSVEVRRRIGYMAENSPLYLEMRISEYLHYRAGIKGLYGAERKKRIGYVLDRCWITDVRRQIIGTLSKGYRQRVALADALLTSPPVLILDEPTAGLDPAQIRSTRGLIRELGQEHTILLSTHILSEVEMTCDSVIIINRGKVAISSSLADLARKAGERARLVAIFDHAVESDAFLNLPGLTEVVPQALPDGALVRLSSPDMVDLAPKVCALAAQKGWRIRELRSERATLEDLFVQITGEV